MKVGIITDIHEDIVTLRKAFTLLEKAGCDEIACLGDIVGFSALYHTYFDSRNASECLRMVRNNCKFVIAGNHDLYAVRKISVYRGGFQFPAHWYQMTYLEKKRHSGGRVWLYEDEIAAELTPSDHEYLHSLPEYIILETPKVRILLSHFIYPDITGSEQHFPRSGKDLIKHLDFVRNNNCTIGVFGHLHARGLVRYSEAKNHFVSFFDNIFPGLPAEACQLNQDLQCVAAPALVATEKKSRLSILNTADLLIECININ